MHSEHVAAVIKQRKTWKVMAPVDQPIEHSSETLAIGDQKVEHAISNAQWAPFHYDRGVDGVPEPWRLHILTQKTCRTLAKEFSSLFTDLKPSNKLPSMLSACGSLILVTWLPQFTHGATSESADSAGEKEKQIQIDEEHLAATAAYVQNLLLLLTADGLGTYWSSGGQFRSIEMFRHLNIPANQRLLAAVFVDYDPHDPSMKRVSGKLREKRTNAQMWKRTL